MKPGSLRVTLTAAERSYLLMRLNDHAPVGLDEKLMGETVLAVREAHSGGSGQVARVETRRAFKVEALMTLDTKTLAQRLRETADKWAAAR